jgi:type II secretory pathway pseudopilin PulG
MRDMVKRPVLSDRGAVLMLLIVAIMILAIIGAAIYSITATSTLSQAEAQKAVNAFYAAEAGTRLVASEYKAAAAGDKTGTLESLNGRTFNLPNNRGQFTVRVYPYWFFIPSTAAGYSANASSITVRLPGSIPPLNEDGSATTVSIPSSGRLKVMGKGQVARFSSGAVSGSNVTFNLSRAFPFALNPGDEFYLSFLPSTSQTVFKKGTAGQNTDLVLKNVAADAQNLPPENGAIAIALPNVGIFDFRYDKRIPAVVDPSNPPATVTLTNIDDLDSAKPAAFPLNIVNCAPSDDGAGCHDDYGAPPPRTTLIYLGRSLAIQSVGTFGP